MGKLSPNNSIRNSSPLLESERKVVSYGKVGIVVLLFLMLFTVPVVAVGESSTPYLDLSYYPNPETPVDTQSLTLSLQASHATISVIDNTDRVIKWDVTSSSSAIKVIPTNDRNSLIEIYPESVGTAMVRAYYADDQSFIGETTVAVTQCFCLEVNRTSKWTRISANNYIHISYL